MPRRRHGLMVALVLVLALPGAAAAELPAYHPAGTPATGHIGKLRAPKPPAPTVLGKKGTFPDVYVDAAGTSHIVWNEDGGAGADVLRYCRLKRGSHTCDNPAATQRLVPGNTYGPGDGPQFNKDDYGPAIVASGNQLILLTHRYPTSYPKPDGSSPSSTTLEWVSDDGGNSFSGPAVVGHVNILGGAVAFGPPTDPTVAAIGGGNGLCDLCVQGIQAGRYASSVADLGAEGRDHAYSPSLAVGPDGLPVAAFADLTNHTYIRRFVGGPDGDVGDISQWTPSFRVPGEDPDLAGGPKGVFVATKPQAGGPFSVRKLSGRVAGAAHAVTEAEHDAYTQLFEDPAGNLTAAWSDTGPAAGAGLKVRSSSDGASWGLPRTILGGDGNGQIAVGSTFDGGGVVVANHTGGINTPGEIDAVGIGTAVKNGRPGIGNLPGGGDPSVKSGCQQIEVGALSVTNPATEGCFFHGTGAQANVDVSGATLDLNGIKIVPDKNVKILFDPHKHELSATGGVSVVLRAPGIGDITLWHGTINTPIGTDVGDTLFSFDTSKFPAVLKGFPIKGKIDIILTNGGVKIPVSLALPSYLGGIRGAATLLADKKTGLHLDSLAIDVPEAPIGPLLIKNLHIGYQGANDVWDGHATFVLPPQPGGPSLDASVEFDKGSFKKGSLTLTPPFPPGISIGPGIFLSQVGGSVALDPLVIGLHAQFGAIPLTPKGPFTATVDGDATLTFGSPVTFDFRGTGAILGVSLAHEELLVNSDGFAKLSADFQLDLPSRDSPLVSAGGSFSGFVDAAKKQFGADLKGDVSLVGEKFAGARLTVSTRGVGGCYDLSIFSLGFGYHWGDTLPDILFPSCDLSPYQVVPGAATPPGQPPSEVHSATFKVAAGTPSISIRLTGNGGPPVPEFQDPEGNLVAPGFPGDEDSKAFQTGPDEVVVGIPHPKAGTWKVLGNPTVGRRALAASTLREPRAQAAAATVSGASIARGLPAPKVSGHLGGRGRSRTLRYSATRRSGLTVTFFETGHTGTRILRRVSGGKGTLRFSTGTGAGGRRTVYALIENRGMPRLKRKIGSYTAPSPPGPARPAHVRVRRTRTGAVVTWSRSAGAYAYLVRVSVADGRRLARVLSGKARQLRIPRVAKRYAVTATVAGRTRTGRAGRARGAKLAAAQARPKTRKTKRRGHS